MKLTWWGWLAIMVTLIGGLGLSAVVSTTAAHRAIAESQAASRLAAEQARQVTCQLIVAQDEVANDPDNPPVSPRQIAAAKAWRAARLAFHC